MASIRQPALWSYSAVCSPTDVVGFIKHHHCLLGELLGDQPCNLRVQQVGVVEDDHVSLLHLRRRRSAWLTPRESGLED